MNPAGLFNQTITIAAKNGYNEEGRETVGGSTSVLARIQETTRRRLLPNNTLVTIDAIAYVPSSTTVTTDDKVSYNNTNYKVYGKYLAVDGSGQTNHIKLELTKWQAT